MMTFTRVRVVAVLVLALGVWWGIRPAAGQSLGDVARREAERRKAIAAKGPVVILTNNSLRSSSVDAPTLPPAPAAASTEKPPDSEPAVEAAPDPKKQPEYWQKRINDAKAQHDRNAVLMAALQSRLNALWADFTARDDPAQRAVIASDRQRALDELARMKKEQEAVVQELENIQEEARRANIPPGWLR